ncbi:MAG: glycoside hydrolase family 28 protein, partial [Lachnospiraceae bacterium]|nr:glycoside hydrolase family 28 protein [Lachnospiraceae bacterium]
MQYNILDYQAVGDGSTRCTAAIQAAIDDCAAAQGGQVVIPAGRYLSGSLRLRSNVDLHLSSGAVLISSLAEEDMIDFSKEFTDDNEDTGWEG